MKPQATLTECFITPEGLRCLPDRCGWAIISADNPNGKRLSDAENTELRHKFRAELNESWMHFLPAVGRFDGLYEHPFIVVGHELTTPRCAQYARDLGQQCVLSSDGLVYADGSVEPLLGLTVSTTAPDDNYTQVGSELYFQATFGPLVPASK